jgi:nitrous oxidase accessory protein
VPKSGRTFHIHHNYFRDTYSIEFVRNGVEIDHNLFDFDVQKDHGNLISAFGNAAAPGPASFHNNLVSNPGRGVMWMNEPYGKLEVRNNHIIARPTKEPRTDGLFGFNEKSGFAEFRFADNIIECEGTPRPLFRNDASGTARVENNKLMNITDTARYQNQATGKPQGLEQPLKFECGVNGELTVDGWRPRKTVAR